MEEAKLKRLPPEKELSRKVAVVVGSGSGIGQAIAEIVLRALARPCLGRARDAVEQHHACEPRATIVGDADRGGDGAIGALGLREHREQRRGLFIDRQRVPAAVVDVRSDPPSSAREREGGIVPPRFDENPEDPARHDLA